MNCCDSKYYYFYSRGAFLKCLFFFKALYQYKKVRVTGKRLKTGMYAVKVSEI